MTEQERLQQEWLILLEEDDWASAVRRRLAEVGRTQEDLARHIEVPLGRVNRHLRGVGHPDDREMKAVARALAYWAKGRFLSWHRVADAIRPIRSPRIFRKLALLPVAAVLLALVPMPAQAQTQLAWGPGGIEVGASSPVYSQPFRVIDAMAGTLSDAHRRIWVKARNAALANWDIRFTVERVPESALAYPWTDDNVNSGLAFSDLVPGAILLVRSRSASPGLFYGQWNPDGLGGVAVYSPWSPWWRIDGFAGMVGMIGHELGHCLGFGHGGTGIMAGNDKPNAVELTALHAYWG